MESSRSILEIVVDVMRQASTLLRTEASLARAEMSENFEDLAKGIAMLVAGATLLIPGLVLLLQAAAAALIATGLADYWSLAIFGGSAFLLGIVLTAIGRRRLRLFRLKPAKALVGLERDAAMAKEHLGTTHATTQRAA
jgi:hypothetical protein